MNGTFWSTPPPVWLAVALGSLLLVGGSAAAQDQEQEQLEEAAEQQQEAQSSATLWTPPEPNATAFDWIQMRSGEWLKGEFEGLRSQRVRFDSDEFDEIELDWDKVTTMYLPRPHSYRIEGRVYHGTAEMRGDVLRIRTDEEILEFRRDAIVSVTAGGERESKYWSGSLGFALSTRQGNTDSTDLTGSGLIRRETALTRWITDYRGSISRVDSDEVANNHRANTAFDVFLTDRLFVTVPFAEYYRDRFQNIESRITPGAAVGYELIRNAWVDWDSSIGVAYQYTKLTAGSEGRVVAHDNALVYTLDLDLDLTRYVDLDSSYALQLVTTDLDKTNHHGEAVLSVEVWGPVDLDVSFIWDRIESPPERDGDTPKQDDFRLLVGLEIDF